MKELVRAFATFAAVEGERKHAVAVLASAPQRIPADDKKRARAAETILVLDAALDVLSNASGRSVALAFLEWNSAGRIQLDPRSTTHATQETSRPDRSRRPGHFRG